MLRSCDALPVVFKMYNRSGEVIFEEERVILLSTLLQVQYAYTMTKPDACVRFTIDIAFPKMGEMP